MRRPASPAAMFSALMYQVVLSLAALVGVAAYASGLGLEATLLRVVMALLASSIVCYAANAGLWLSQIGRAPTEVVLRLPPPSGHAVTGQEIELEARRVYTPAGSAETEVPVGVSGQLDRESAG